jgi:hypothetical protein
MSIYCSLCRDGSPHVYFDGVTHQCYCDRCYDPTEGGAEQSAARGVGETEWDAVQDWVRVCDEILEDYDPGVALNPMWAQLEEQLAAERERTAFEAVPYFVAGLKFYHPGFAREAAGWS